MKNRSLREGVSRQIVLVFLILFAHDAKALTQVSRFVFAFDTAQKTTVILKDSYPRLLDDGPPRTGQIAAGQYSDENLGSNRPTRSSEWTWFGLLVFLFVAGLFILLLILKFRLSRMAKPGVSRLACRYITLALAFGLVVAILDAFLDSLFFYKGRTFWSLLILDVPPHEIYMRLLIVIGFTIFGVLLSIILIRQSQAEQLSNLRNKAIENSPNGVVITENTGGRDHPVLYANPAFERISGYSFDEVKGRDMRFLRDKDNDQPALDELRQSLNHCRPCQVTLRNYRKDGSLFWNELAILPVLDKQGLVSHFIGLLNDVTERVQYQRALHESQMRFKNTFQQAYQFSVLIDLQGKVTEANDLCYKVTGLTKDRVIGLPFSELPWWKFDSRTQADTLQDIQTAIDGHVANREIAYLNADKEERMADRTISPVYDEDGKLIFLLAQGLDVTERKRAEQALYASEERFRLMFETSTLGMALCEMDGTLLEANSAYLNIIGYSFEEMLKLSYWDLTPREYDAQEALQLRSMQETGKYGPYEKEYIRKTGERIPVLLNGMKIKGTDGVPRIWSIVEDITDRKRAEQEREELLKDLAQKNEELENIVYVSSHDLRSPLINITGYSAEFLRSCEHAVALAQDPKVPQDIAQSISSVLLQDVRDSLDYIQSSAKTMDALLAGLLKLSRLGQAALDIQPLDMNQVMKEVIKSMQFRINESGVQLTVDELPACMGDKSLVQQVFANLLDNAIKYRDPMRRGVVQVSGRADGGMSVYCVRDNGVGIDPAHYAKVFEIFHRLQPRQSPPGEGLGLTIARRIVLKHNGKIWVESQAGKGSSFYVALPHAKTPLDPTC